MSTLRKYWLVCKVHPAGRQTYKFSIAKMPRLMASRTSESASAHGLNNRSVGISSRQNPGSSFGGK